MLKNVTLSVEERLLEAGRRRAAERHSTLNEEFRQWLERYVGDEGAREAFDDLMSRLGHVRSGGPFDRDTLNER